MHAHEVPAAAQLLAVEVELELALAIAFARIVDGDPFAAIPHDHGAGAVLSLRDHALEAAVAERMVLDVHGHAPHMRIEARALGNRPALERAVELEPEVVVQAPRGVLLDHEREAFGLARDFAFRFRGDAEVALLAVFAEGAAHVIAG